MRILVFAVLCLIFVLCEGHGSWNRCYSCRNAYSNRACNRHYENCHTGQYTCLSLVVKNTNGRYTVSKRCARLNECPSSGHQQSYCRGRVCSSCCYGYLCNAKAQWSGGTAPVSTVAPGTCPLGCKGDQGYPGPSGIPGPVGSVGSPGVVGRPGLPGMPGRKGDSGVPGFPGVKGEPGLPGIDGARGILGPKGERGRDGQGGFPGRKGDMGIEGPKGECPSKCKGGQGQIPTRRSFVAFSGAIFKVKQADEYFTICPTKIFVNEGAGFDAATGIFKTLIPGVYSFSCVSIADGSGATPCELYKNKELIFTTARDEDATGPYPLGTNQALVTLNLLDIVQFKVTPKKTGFWGNISNKFKSPSDITINGHLVHPAN